MDLREAETLVDELLQLLGSGPGEDAERLARVSDICWKFRNASWCDQVLADRLLKAREMFGFWFSAQAWKQWGADGTGARIVLNNDLHDVRLAIASCFAAGKRD